MNLPCAHVLAKIHHRALGSTVEGWDEASVLTLVNNTAVMTTTIGAEGCLNPEEGTEPVVGFAVSLKTEPEADLLTVAIDPNYQGHGLGKALIEAQLHILKSQGVRTWYLEVHEHNERAITFYTHMGFHLCARRPHYYPSWRPDEGVRAAALVMCRDLGHESAYALERDLNKNG